MDAQWIAVIGTLISTLGGIGTVYVGRRMILAERRMKLDESTSNTRRKIQQDDSTQLRALYEQLRSEARKTEESLRQEIDRLRIEHERVIHQLREEHRHEVRELTALYERRVEGLIQFIAQKQGQKEAHYASSRIAGYQPAALAAGDEGSGDQG